MRIVGSVSRKDLQLLNIMYVLLGFVTLLFISALALLGAPFKNAEFFIAIWIFGYTLWRSVVYTLEVR